MIRAATRSQFIRYASVGIASNLSLYLAYLLLTASGIGHKTAMTSLYALGVLMTFVANRAWSFKHKGAMHTALVRYAAASLFGYALNWLFLWTAVDILRLPHQAVQAIAICIVAGCLFLLNKFWVFAPRIQRGNP